MGLISWSKGRTMIQGNSSEMMSWRKHQVQLLPFINHKGPPESRHPVDGTTDGQNDTSTIALDMVTKVTIL